MSMIYFPSCKFTAKYPKLSKAVKNYMKERFCAETAGCCRPILNKVTNEDTLIYVCNTCATFFKESTSAKKIVSLWELILEDQDFVYPDYEGCVMTVQDCWRTYDDRGEQDAVREVLRRMNIQIIELKENFEKTRFCGYSLYEPLPPRYDELAPKRLGREAEGLFASHTQGEKEQLMKEYCKQFTTEDVVCYCVACVNGINLGGRNGIHLAQLLFPDTTWR